MALINCPECGRKVSDSAVMCPNCGFNVKESVEAKKAETNKPNVSEERATNAPEKPVIADAPKMDNKKNPVKSVIIGIVCIIAFYAIFLIVTKYASYVSTKKQYDEALAYYNSQEWRDAIKGFKGIEDYSDSAKLMNDAKQKLATEDYELGLVAYSIAEFSSAVDLLHEAKTLNPSVSSGIDEQIKLAEFMDKLQGTWKSAGIEIEVAGFKARLKDYDCDSFAAWCDITPYKSDKGYYTILVKGEPGYRFWELTYEEGTSKDEWSSDWLGSPSNADVRGYFNKEE